MLVSTLHKLSCSKRLCDHTRLHLCWKVYKLMSVLWWNHHHSGHFWKHFWVAIRHMLSCGSSNAMCSYGMLWLQSASQSILTGLSVSQEELLFLLPRRKQVKIDKHIVHNPAAGRKRNLDRSVDMLRPLAEHLVCSSEGHEPLLFFTSKLCKPKPTARTGVWPRWTAPANMKCKESHSSFPPIWKRRGREHRAAEFPGWW